MTDNVTRKAYMVNCFLCGSENVKKAQERRPVDFNKIRYFYKCQNCKGYSLWPKLEKWEIEKLYSINYIGDVNPDSPPDYETNMARFNNVKDFLTNTHNPEGKSFLDYGCGASAEVVILAKSLLFNSYGVEVEQNTRILASEKSGCKIYSPEEITKEQIRFDIVFMGDLLEHVSNPGTVLSNATEYLRDDGYLVIQGPLEGAVTLSNFLVGLKARLMAERPTTFPPYHVLLATQESMMKMLSANNLHVTIKQITEPLWPAVRIWSKESITSPSKFLYSFAKLIDMAVHKINKSYGTRIFLVAQKKIEQH